ncbi:fam-a protein [Plasmodium vinckei vinckei]|uniref:Fam-a protein n=1 Tax=Plasmodium vinckei vinckei TaxID=54757 RepID=A0A449BRX7_PLAVN|nr:fam-a protein [Plasmodium vinckei vinckei]VEV56185.1 fam-a protein [Plasmodium vinckei vinckei]
MNKFYIQTALFILSIFAYANNGALAAEPAPGEDTKQHIKDQPLSRHSTSEELYEKVKYLSCRGRKHTQAIELMNDAVKQLEYYATTKDGYKPYLQNPTDSLSYYIKKFDNETNILKAHLNIYDSNQYNAIINRIWNPLASNIFNKGHVTIGHVYNPNLMMIRQDYKKDSKGYQKYFYALISKTEISKDKTIIAMTSVNVNDSVRSGIEYKNPILERANSFITKLIITNEITDEKYKIIHVNLAGYLIEKKGDALEITYIESIQGHSSF